MPAVDLVNPKNPVVAVSFSPHIWAHLLELWQRHAPRLEELSGVQRHWIIPLTGDPTLSKPQWEAVQSTLLIFARKNPQHRDWISQAILEINQQVKPQNGP